MAVGNAQFSKIIIITNIYIAPYIQPVHRHVHTCMYVCMYVCIYIYIYNGKCNFRLSLNRLAILNN